MWKWVQALDSILRGETTQPSRLREGPLDIPAGGLLVLIVLLGAVDGFCMGCFALFNRDSSAYGQLVASMVKVPALFLLTLLITFPSLYVFNALVGSRLTLLTFLRLLIATLAVTLAVLASFGPIVAFFSLTTANYSFMVLLNVLQFTVAGVLGLAFLLQTLHRLTLLGAQGPPVLVEVSAPRPGAGDEPALPVMIPAEPSGALGRLGGSVLGRSEKAVFLCWMVVFALVGAQMSWVLRPFIGNPDQPFEWFRPRESHFFEAVGRALVNLFS